MSMPPLIQTEEPPGAAAERSPAPLRLVNAFNQAMRSSSGQADILEEAFEVEGLLIAAVYSFEAFIEFIEHWHQGEYSDPPVRSAGPEQLLLDGHEAWGEAADLLHSRVVALQTTGYEPRLAGRFASLSEKARGLWEDASARRALDRVAVRVDRLESLASRVIPLQTAYDDEGPPS